MRPHPIIVHRVWARPGYASKPWGHRGHGSGSSYGRPRGTPGPGSGTALTPTSITIKGGSARRCLGTSTVGFQCVGAVGSLDRSATMAAYEEN